MKMVAIIAMISIGCVLSLSAADRERVKTREKPARDFDRTDRPDNLLERKELRAAVDAELKALDADKDGRIDHGEKKSLKELRSRLDKDGDGVIDRESIKKLREVHPETHERVMRRMREGRERDGREASKDRVDSQTREQNRETYIDKREANQQRRIDHGVKMGYLTAEETKKLQAMESQIESAESAFKSDGKLTRDEAKQLKDMLDNASVQIWAEKHDTEGNQMPTYRYGKNVFAKDEFTSKIESGNMTGTDARALMHEFHEASKIKRRLANDYLSVQERADLQAKYNEFLNKYFVVR